MRQLVQCCIDREHGVDVAAGFENPGAYSGFAGTQPQDQVVEFARHRQRPPLRTRGVDRLRIGRLCRCGCENGNRRGARVAIDQRVDVAVVQTLLVDSALERCERDAPAGSRAGALRGECGRALLYRRGELLRLRDVVDQFPLQGAVRAHALRGAAEHVCAIAPYLALVGQACQSAGARQDAEQRYLRQAHGGRAVVDHQDLVAGECQLVAAARHGAVHCGEKFQPVVPARIFHAVAGLVGELAEVHFPGVRRLAEHVDVGARAEHAFARRGDHRALHLRMLEADAVQRVVQFDVHAEVVGVELELVTWAQPPVLVHVHRQCGELAVDKKLPVDVAVRMRVVGDCRVMAGGLLEYCAHDKTPA